jgi:hypothetical protein
MGTIVLRRGIEECYVAKEEKWPVMLSLSKHGGWASTRDPSTSSG